MAATSPWTFSSFLADAGDDTDRLVAQVRRLRARILFDQGRRPAFRNADDQEQDYGAWHFIARRGTDGTPLGYVRLLTPRTGLIFQSREFLGAGAYEALLRAEGLRPDSVFEHSRLVVEHRARKLGLGLHLNAMAMGAAHALGAQAMVGTSGTADGQDGFHARFGFRRVERTRRYVERYTEDVVLMLHKVIDGAGEFAGQVAEYRDQFAATLPKDVIRPSAASAMPVVGKAGGLPGYAPGVSTFLGPGDPNRWRPILLEARVEADRVSLDTLTSCGAVRELCDTIETQIEELITSRDPARPRDAASMRAAKEDQLAGAEPWQYGTWVWYPWSGRLVHVLPEAEYRLVRTDRNRGKISRPQQRGLLGKRIGVVGLSVGSSAAVTLAQEGVGGAFKLADFDDLGLSNLNRLRCGAHDLGVNKAVIAARQMFEIDPYLDIEIFPEGLTEDTMKEFFVGGAGAIDLLVEECDTPWVKIAARETARKLGVPVVMDANDRGLLDVERFDLEPRRPLLHGRLGDTRSADLSSLTRQEVIELIVTMVDAERISPAMAASIPEIGRTLSSWPQLASGVALGGALVVEAARRILLGKPCGSGRFYVDLEELIAPDRDTAAMDRRARALDGSLVGAGAVQARAA